MLYIAHRGVSNQRKENSLEAINLAIHQNQYNGVEIDVQLCKSGEIVLHHDLYLHNNWIKDLNYDELKMYDVISLEDLYKRVPMGTKMLILDIKGDDYSIIEKINEFYKFMDVSNVYFCSFNRPMLYYLNPKFKIGRTFESFFLPTEYPIVLKDVDIIIIHWTCLNYPLMHYCNSNNIRVFTYTHKNNIEHKYMLRFNIDGIITNGIFSK